MFEEKKLIDLFHSLAPTQQDEVLDFMEFLKERKARVDQVSQVEKPPPIEPEHQKPFRQFGAMKGLVIYMADDFDAPMDEFAEYM